MFRSDGPVPSEQSRPFGSLTVRAVVAALVVGSSLVMTVGGGVAGATPTLTATTTTMDDPSGAAAGVPTELLASTAASGVLTGTFTFSVDGSVVPTCTDVANVTDNYGAYAECLYTFTTTGSHAVTATYNGDSTFAPSTAPDLDVPVLLEATVTTTVTPTESALPGPREFSVDVTGSGPTPTGTVDIKVQDTSSDVCTVTLVDGQGSCDQTSAYLPDNAYSYIPAGVDHTLVGAYSGDANYASTALGSSSPSSSFTIDQTATTTSLTVSQSPGPASGTTTYTMTSTIGVVGTAPGVGALGGISFMSGGVSICDVDLSEAAPPVTETCSKTFSSSPGPTITAVFTGDTDYAASQSAAVNTAPTVYPVTVTAIASSPTATPGHPANTATAGEAVEYGAVVTSSHGNVGGLAYLSAGGVPLCTALIVSNDATCSSTAAPVGSDVVTALFTDPNNVYMGGSASTLLQVVPAAPSRYVGTVPTPDNQGYWTVAADGEVDAFGDAKFYGSMVGSALRAPVVGMAATPDGHGYWLVATDGGIFAFGDAAFYGSTGGITLNKPIAGMVPTPDGHGYWFVASDGGIFAYGDAAFHGSMGGSPLNQPVVGMAADRATGGYWLVAADGGIFSFDAPFLGSTGNIRLNKPIVGMEAAPSGTGYRFVASDGGVFCFGLPFNGSMGGTPLNAPVVAMAADGSNGYWLLGADGGIFSFDAPFFGG